MVSFCFGGRHQAKTQAFQRPLTVSTVEVPAMGDNMRALLALSLTSPGVAATDPDPALELVPIAPGGNAPLVIW